MTGFFDPTTTGVRSRRTGVPGNGVALQSKLATEAPVLDWSRFIQRVDWRRGEHFGLIGPTGGGKTNMLISLLPLHPFVAVFATKPRDSTMESLIRVGGYYRMDVWHGGVPADQVPRRVLWPDATKLDSVARQKEVFSAAMDRIYREGGWTVGIDELYYFSSTLKLSDIIRTYYTQARALDISLCAATQRPSRVPLEMYDQSTHLMFWRTTDKQSLDRIQDINYGNSDLLRHIVSNLRQHQVLYINTRTGFMCRTTAPKHAATIAGEGGNH